ncbi:unnamed protein product [Phytomonas sp. Hart1]|nr:unnamed protein product [Phytomonas sp. Hart1]|eukprot:CCW70256.1 unnamed protein product [Phytomonas sp. isolate Hart1]
MSFDGASSELVTNVVYLQRTSPTFADFCISHATSPNYRFLYSQEDTIERRLYLRLLDEAQRKDTLGAVSEKRSLPRHRKSTMAEGTDGFLSYDVRTVWCALHNRVLWPFIRLYPSTRGDSGPCSQSPTSPRLSPQAPLIFSSPQELRRFMMDVLHAAEKPQKANVECVVDYMLSRLPMTECFLLVITYLVEELLGFGRMHYPPRRSLQAFFLSTGVEFCGDEKGTNQLLKRTRPDGGVSAVSGNDEFLIAGGSREGGDNGGSVGVEVDKGYQEVSFYMEAAGTVFFIAAMLFAQHHNRESQLPNFRTAMCPNSTSRVLEVEDKKGLYYQCAFDYYILRMVQAFTRAAKVMCHNSEHNFSVFGFVADTLQVWLADHYFPSEDTKDKAKLILGRMTAISGDSIVVATDQV